MKNVFSFILLIGCLAVFVAKADQPVQSYSLAPTFHYIDAVRLGRSGACESDPDRSINFSYPIGQNHSFLGALRLNVYAVNEPGGESLRQIELVGLTLDKSTSVNIRFITSKTALDILVKSWVMAPKRKWFLITEDASCVGDTNGYSQVSSFSKSIQ